MLIAPKEYLLQYILSLLYTGNQLGEAIPSKTPPPPKKKWLGIVRLLLKTICNRTLSSFGSTNSKYTRGGKLSLSLSVLRRTPQRTHSSLSARLRGKISEWAFLICDWSQNKIEIDIPNMTFPQEIFFINYRNALRSCVNSWNCQCSSEPGPSDFSLSGGGGGGFKKVKKREVHYKDGKALSFLATTLKLLQCYRPVAGQFGGNSIQYASSVWLLL